MGHIGRDLVGRTVGIVGLGRIGYAFAKRCAMGWWMRVLYSDHKRNTRAEAEVGAKWVDFDTLLAQSDFISVHCSLNEATRGMFDLEAFRKMKSTAVFVNTARGPVHVHEDLTRALADGEIFAAGLDVTDPEPLPSDDPLLALPNVVVAPHIASATTTTRDAMAAIAADNLLAGLEGRRLRAPVNPEVESGRRR
jgi:glyoxylate reductase